MSLSCPRPVVGALALCLGLLGFAPQLAAQEPYTITGTVVDAASQQPLSGAAVAISGTQIGTLTGVDGRFSLQAKLQPGNYVIRVSQLGHGEVNQPITLGADRVVNLGAVALQPSALKLQEVVVTGTGAPTQKKELGNTVATVRGEEVNQAAGAQSISQALQGKVIGAVISQNNGQPGGGVSIRLRGTGSILGGAEPLIVIDGVIVDNNSDALVSLGANAGRGGAALTNALSDIAPSDIDHIEVVKGAAAAALYGSRANNGVIQIFTKRGKQGEPRVTYRLEAATGVAPHHYDLNYAPTATYGDVVFGPASSIGAPVERFDYQDQIFQRTASITNHLSVTGGNAGTTYFASANWQNATGIVRGSDLSNINTRAKLTQQLSDKLNFTVGGNYIQKTSDFVPEGEQTQGAITTLIFTPTSFDPTYDPNLGRYPYSPILGTNPLDVIANWKARDNVNRFIGSFNTTWTPISSLTVNYLFGLDRTNESFTYYQPPRATSKNFPGSISNPTRGIQRFNNDLTITHEKDVSDGMHATTTLGLRQTYDHTDVVYASASDLPPGQITVGGATQRASESIVEMRTLGGFLQERLGFNDRLYLTGGLNYEASSAFGANQRWQLFPRLGASWLIGQAPFFQNSALSNVFSTLRLRAAYGETGGQPPSAYSIFDNYANVASGGKPGLIPGSVAGNPNLKPEREREYEAGFDAGFLDNRLSLDFTWYDKHTTDLVLGVPLPLSSGYSSQLQNIGALSNKGIEVGINSLNVDRPGFQWNTRFGFAANRSEVEKLVTAADTLQFGYLNEVIVGQPVGVFYGAYYPRDAQGNIVATGRLDSACQPIGGTEGIIVSRARDANCTVLKKVLGSPEPDWTASLSNSFNIGTHLELSFLLDGRFGNEVGNFTRRISEFFGAGASNANEQCVTADNGNLYCQETLNSERNLLYEEFVEDGSFVKLREAAIRYYLDGPWVRRLGAEGLTLSLSGRNLYTWTDYTGIDPEVNLFSANTVARGVEFGTSPIPRVFALGLTVNF